MTTYIFTVNNTEHKVEADSAGMAMVWMNRNIMDALALESWAWMDGSRPNTFYAAFGNFFD